MSVLEHFIGGWLPLQTAAEEANWAASTDVSEAHTGLQVAKNLELNRFVGAPQVIETVQSLLKNKGSLPDETVRQLEKIRLRAAEAPGTVPEVVKARAEAEAKQSAAQDGFAFTLRREGKNATVSANDIDGILVGSRDLDERRAAWEASKTIGRPLRDGLLRLRDLRNKVARAMGFDDFFALQVADYGMTVPEMMALCERMIAEVNPLYQQLHAWSRAGPRAAIPRRGSARRQGAGALVTEPMGPELAEPGRRSRHGRTIQRQDQGVHHRASRAILRLARVSQTAAIVLGEIRPLSGRPQVRAARRTATRAPGISTCVTTYAA